MSLIEKKQQYIIEIAIPLPGRLITNNYGFRFQESSLLFDTFYQISAS